MNQLLRIFGIIVIGGLVFSLVSAQGEGDQDINFGRDDGGGEAPVFQAEGDGESNIIQVDGESDDVIDEAPSADESGGEIAAAPAATPNLAPEATPDPELGLPVRGAPPAPAARVRGDDATLTLFFEELAQGGLGLVQVIGAEEDDAIAGVSARWLDRTIMFYPFEDGAFYGVLAASMEQSPRRYGLDVFVTFADESTEAINTEVSVILGGFIRQNVELPPFKGFLLDPEVERDELARLESIAVTTTEEHLWDPTGFQMPIFANLTSPFGAFRSFNETFNTRHTGWDINTTLGVPIMAMSSGRVAYTGLMNIRGNYVMIDHGYGIYSGYAHLSQMHVTRGQEVVKGQIIGVTGDTGRTSGPHFHWETTVNGEWVDGVELIRLWLP